MKPPRDNYPPTIYTALHTEDVQTKSIFVKKLHDTREVNGGIVEYAGLREVKL